jgi:hypothetical protein
MYRIVLCAPAALLGFDIAVVDVLADYQVDCVPNSTGDEVIAACAVTRT